MALEVLHILLAVATILVGLPSAYTERTLGTPCVPVTGKTALFIGQDYYSILNYSAAVRSDPFGVMTYTGEKNVPRPFLQNTFQNIPQNMPLLDKDTLPFLLCVQLGYYECLPILGSNRRK